LIIESESDLAIIPTLKTPYFILGKGSNTVIDPNGRYTTFIQLSPAYQPPVATGHQLHIGAGVSVKTCLDFCITAGLSGLEFSAGIPASIGGMVVMNFGCWGSEMADCVEKVQVWNAEKGCHWISKAEMAYAYRSSMIQHNPGHIVLSVLLNLTPENSDLIRERVYRYIKERNDKQPIRDKTFGSTFKNPPGHFAAALIESIGFKGHAFGGVKFSERHANFLINTGNATFADVQNCLRTTKETVKEKHHIDLEAEVKLAS
jgi:UDP-N-acetylmuramate dehydrogenase